MKRFVFGLQPVLGYRKRIEDEKQQVHAQRRRELLEAQSELSRLDGEFRRHSTVLREDHRSLKTDELRTHYAHLEYLDRRITMQHATIAQRAMAAEASRRELVEAGKERKAIEKLKERRYDEYRAFAASAEQKELDDANSHRRGIMP